MNKLHFILFLLFFQTANSQVGKFTYQYHSDIAKAGKFIFTADDENLEFETPASAGYLAAANNPYLQATKNIGPIPNGTWIVYAIKNEGKFILRLKPTDDVNITYRDGFLIHGTGTDRTPEESSLGCIILDRDSRKKLVKAFKKYGEFKIIVSNLVTGEPSNGD